MLAIGAVLLVGGWGAIQQYKNVGHLRGYSEYPEWVAYRMIESGLVHVPITGARQGWVLIIATCPLVILSWVTGHD